MLDEDWEALKMRIAGRETEIGTVCPVVVRSLDRLADPDGRECWRATWNELKARGDAYDEKAICWVECTPVSGLFDPAILRARLCAALAYARACGPHEDPVLEAALDAGTPVALWHRVSAARKTRRADLERVLRNRGLRDLPDECSASVKLRTPTVPLQTIPAAIWSCSGTTPTECRVNCNGMPLQWKESCCDRLADIYRYRDAARPHRPPAGSPNWRAFDGGPPLPNPGQSDPGTLRRLGLQGRPGRNGRVPDEQEIQMVNAALFLRRPLLVTGRPGTGKSTLAYSIAKELKLGPVLRWPITSRSTLLEGLYRYDAIGQLREENLWQLRARTSAEVPAAAEPYSSQAVSFAGGIGRHLRLGPLGTSLLPYGRPRVLLIDEIDKSDIDLPNDLLNVFEEGEYDIDELARLPEEAGPVRVMTADSGGHVAISRGHVRCLAFPFVLLTSNGEREFPPAFLRRCLRLDLQPPDQAQVEAIVTAHLGPEAAAGAGRHVREFLDRRTRSEVTTDQLLNAVYLATSGSRHQGRSPQEIASLEQVASAVMRPLSGTE